ncbi:MAG: hypothetical protein Q7R64_04795 [bacterium]|nr:hypothetical protein [bacterium]
MSPEERQLLIQTHRMVEENHALLRKMHRSALFGRVFHMLYWIIIIGLSVGAYFFVQPYVEQVQSVYGGLRGDVQNVKNATSQLGTIGNFFKGSAN